MPKYEYLCESCGHRFEVFQHIADTPLTTCPNCSGHIHRVLFPAGIVFKGSGFYKTDSRGTSSASTPPPTAAHDAGSPASANGKTAQPTEKSEAKTESKSEPAAKSDTSSASGASASN